jgi:hypothetical protein
MPYSLATLQYSTSTVRNGSMVSAIATGRVRVAPKPSRVDASRPVVFPASMASFSTGSRVHSPSDEKIDSQAYYIEYSGHRVAHLKHLLPHLRASSNHLVWTAGDSSLDNKYWFSNKVQAVRGAYRDILHPPTSKPDVTYWLNHIAASTAAAATSTSELSSDNNGVTKGAPRQWSAINTAVEASTLNERTFRMRPQDVFLRDNIRADDVLIVSVGGNDVALMPCPCTIVSITSLVLCLPLSCIENGRVCGTVPLDDCCCGCGPSLCSCFCAYPPCLGYLTHTFGTRLQCYLEALTAKTKPSKILVCMIYFPEEVATERGWADPSLAALRYNTNPTKLQALIRKVYKEAICNIRIPGSQVVPVPLFEVLDGKTSADYIARVEPSPSGGRKMAELLMSLIQDPPHRDVSTTTSLPSASAPSPSQIQERS